MDALCELKELVIDDYKHILTQVYRGLKVDLEPILNKINFILFYLDMPNAISLYEQLKQ